jgi:septal ring factor EnvC (AmiA/AmiB activator)
MSIDFGKIVTNALSTLVAAVFVGAAAIVWHAATSVDERINEANKDIIKQQSALKATQETIVPELTNMKSIIEELRAEIRSLNKLLSDTKALPEKTEYKEGEPVILEEFFKNIGPDWKQKEIDRIKDKIDTRQMEIYDERTLDK